MMGRGFRPAPFESIGRACSALALSIVALAAVPAAQPAQGAQPAQRAAPSRARADGSGPTARYFASIRNNPPLLLAFLNEMPKGGDLHNHLSGAIYAESYLQWAADDNLCLVTATMSIVGGGCDAAAGRPAASAVLQNPNLSAQAIDAMSMRNWDRALNGHDHFFNAFAKFGPASQKTGQMVAEVSARAAAEHVSYLELMITPDGGLAGQKGTAAGWDPDLARMRDKLLATRFDDVVAAATRRLDDAEATRRRLLRCGAPDADAGCGVTLRYIAQATRSSPPEVVFAQLLAGFEVASHEPRVVALNLVAPEDGAVAVRDFPLHMRMLDYLHGLYPAVPITLHAGELVDGLVPPEALRSHIAQSVRVAHARRIGHGAAVMYEDAALDLLKEMAARRVLVEIALTSNDVILGIKGASHPLRTYLRYGVPVALVTDDAGLSRSSLTFEFRKAVEEQGLDYATLKAMARNSIVYSFADDGTRKTLLSELDAAFRRFESGRRPS
jgi:adenosine deaminase